MPRNTDETALLFAAAVVLSALGAGCSHKDSSTALDQQRSAVMGSAAPPEVRAQVQAQQAAQRAAQEFAQQQGSQQAAQKDAAQKH